MRGIDNRSDCGLLGPADAPACFYDNTTGCGNTLDFFSAALIRMVVDSLRDWIKAMHVDGLRFDLAAELGRDMNCDSVADISWFGSDLNPPCWDDPQARTLCDRLDGGEITSPAGLDDLFFTTRLGTGGSGRVALHSAPGAVCIVTLELPLAAP